MDNSKKLNELKEYLRIKTDGELAEFLDINANTLSSWRRRDRIDYEIILAKCNEIDANWLLRGTGNMLLAQNEPQQGAVEITSVPKKDLDLQDLKHLITLNSRSAEAERRELMIQCRTIELALEEVLMVVGPLKKLGQVRAMLDSKAAYAREEYHSKSMTEHGS